MIRFTAGPGEAGERVDAVLARRAGVARSAARRALSAGEVTVSGRAVRPSYRVRSEDVVEGEVVAPEAVLPRPQRVALAVRYSDERVLVVSKPAGLATHPGAGRREGTLVNALLGLGEALSHRGSERPGIVHRLDKDTSGLLLVAKDDEAHDYLVEALKQRLVARRYLALVRGRMPADSGTIEAPVGRHPTRRWRMTVVPEGRPAVSHYRVLGRGDDSSLLEVALETGRTHQIRVHLSYVGHPVLGDGVYGGSPASAAALGLERFFLHAWKLEFPHPDDGRTIALVDPLPPELATALEAAGIPSVEEE